MDFGATGKGKDFKKGELIKALQKKYGKDKIKPNMTMGQLKKIMGNKDGALVAGMKAGIAGADELTNIENAVLEEEGRLRDLDVALDLEEVADNMKVMINGAINEFSPKHLERVI